MKIVGSILGVMCLLLVFTTSVLGSKPDVHKVTVCHAKPSDTAANGWNSIPVDVASSGHLKGGHQEEHDADIIPPYSYYGYNYPGKNWTKLGQAIWENNCAIPRSTPSESPRSTPSVSASPIPSVTPTPTPDFPTCYPPGIQAGDRFGSEEFDIYPEGLEPCPIPGITPPPTDT